MTLLSCLIKLPLVDACSETVDTARSDVLRVVKIERARDVLHVFSHIRKTYRVQWVVLEGGGAGPPELANRSTLASGPRKTKITDSPKPESMWVCLGDVEKAK